MRVGQGFDAHAFAEGRKLILGGVLIPHTHGIAAHSDGDVLLHALTDALLGAANLGDLGKYYPSENQDFKDIDSRVMLRQVVSLLEQKNYMIVNIDTTLIMQKPKVAQYIPLMQANIASDLNITQEFVSVKATTTDHLGFTGRGEGVAALAIVLLGLSLSLCQNPSLAL
jgi:2-C-methyl-D-erythritol 2,4-cyclodiphosphate synthase